MFTPPPQHHPDEHLMHERNRREALERDAGSGHHSNGMTTGDKIIFSVLGIVTLAVLWFIFSWLSGA